MTERLYYNDPNVVEFDGRIVAVDRTDDRHATILDRSAFYPTSGGQLYDIGRLGHADVIEVVEDDAGNVLHLTGEPVGTVGELVRGSVEPGRRQRHRQQHTAQHILSQTFLDLFEMKTVSVHLGEEYGAVELDTENLTPEQLRRAEDRAMEIIFANYPVHILFVDRSEALQMPLRKLPDREGTIRVIKIGEYDYSACGGTHCDATAQVGVLHIVGTTKMRGHVQVNFLAGAQTRSDYLSRCDVTTALTGTFTCHLDDLVDKTLRLVEECKLLRRELTRLQKEMLPAEAVKIAAQQSRVGRFTLVFVDLGEYDPKLAVQLAGLVTERTKGPTALLCGDKLVLTVPPDIGLHAGNLMRELSDEADLRGGGGPAQAQAGGAKRTRLGDYREIMERLLNEA
ncbi:MAG: hypothetical protein KKA81_16340 [Bacteroidetes bacterium]|nr:hypothetical protein [Bacteroidota bacterium]